LLRHEEEAAARSTLNPGCREVLTWAADHGLETALITRNSLQSVRTVLERHGLKIDTLVTRGDGRPKPDPHPLLLAGYKLNVAASAAWMVGDGQYDVEAGAAACVRTVWLSHGRPRPCAAEPWREVRDLAELRAPPE